MNSFVVAAQLAIASTLFPVTAWATDSQCPIDKLVGQIREIDGDEKVVHLRRGGKGGSEVLAMRDACVLYGDWLGVGIDATVIVDTASGPRHFGGVYDLEWDAPFAPSAQKNAPLEWSELVSSLFRVVVGPARRMSRNAIGRASDTCPPSRTSPPPLTPLYRLRAMDQQIGADLREIVAAWTPSEPHRVQARLLGAGGLLIVQGITCLDAHLILPLPSGILHPGGRLTLEITDDHGGKLDYDIVIVEPSKLPMPSITFDGGWLLAAWRLAQAEPGTRLDSIARLVMAPPDALGAQRILEAVWSDTQF